MRTEPKVQFVYEKWLFVELVRLDNNFLYSKRKRKDPTQQDFAFEDTEKLHRDIAMLTENENK